MHMSLQHGKQLKNTEVTQHTPGTGIAPSSALPGSHNSYSSSNKVQKLFYSTSGKWGLRECTVMLGHVVIIDLVYDLLLLIFSTYLSKQATS